MDTQEIMLIYKEAITFLGGKILIPPDSTDEFHFKVYIKICRSTTPVPIGVHPAVWTVASLTFWVDFRVFNLVTLRHGVTGGEGRVIQQAESLTRFSMLKDEVVKYAVMCSLCNFINKCYGESYSGEEVKNFFRNPELVLNNDSLIYEGLPRWANLENFIKNN